MRTVRILRIVIRNLRLSLQSTRLFLFSFFFLSHKVNGSWGEWSEYDTCDAECGPGSQQRVRKCDSPAPQYGGDECEGESEENKDCNLKPCPSALIFNSFLQFFFFLTSVALLYIFIWFDLIWFTIYGMFFMSNYVNLEVQKFTDGGS